MMQLGRLSVPAFVVALAACSAAPPATQPGTRPPPGAATAQVPAAGAASAAAAAASVITADAVRSHVAFLASDELRGRDTPSPGLERAATWLAERFEAMGLEPAGDGGTYIQRWPLEDTRLDVAGLRLEVRTGPRTTRLEFARDYFVLPSTRDSVVGEPLFLGTPAQPGPLGADASGRIVAFFVPDTLGPAWQVRVSGALQSAFQSGVAGVILVLDPDFSAQAIGRIARELQSQVPPFPVFGMRYDVAHAMFAGAGLNLDQLRSAPGQRVPLSGVTVAARTPIATATPHVPNVVAVLRGSDPVLRDEYVVYSAHFDHVGVGLPDATGDSIYNGADDNASGVAALLEAARAFMALPAAPPRSVMFVMVSGEEKGLLGSRFFVANPPVPVDRMAANINADMVGRNAPDSIIAIGLDYSDLGESVQAVAARYPGLGLVVAPDPWPEEQLFFRSDHFSFAAREIPAIFFTAGLHEDYHEPSDQAHLIDNDKVARVARLLFKLGHDIATRPARPAWTPEGRNAVRRGAGGQ